MVYLTVYLEERRAVMVVEGMVLHRKSQLQVMVHQQNHHQVMDHLKVLRNQNMDAKNNANPNQDMVLLVQNLDHLNPGHHDQDLLHPDHYHHHHLVKGPKDLKPLFSLVMEVHVRLGQLQEVMAGLKYQINQTTEVHSLNNLMILMATDHLKLLL